MLSFLDLITHNLIFNNLAICLLFYFFKISILTKTLIYCQKLNILKKSNLQTEKWLKNDVWNIFQDYKPNYLLFPFMLNIDTTKYPYIQKKSGKFLLESRGYYKTFIGQQWGVCFITNQFQCEQVVVTNAMVKFKPNIWRMEKQNQNESQKWRIYVMQMIQNLL